MNKKLLAEFRDVNANPRIVIDYTKVKNLERLCNVLGSSITDYWKYYWYYPENSDKCNANKNPPPFPHRLVTVDDFYEEEWHPVSGEEVELLSHVWKKGRYIGGLDGVYYIKQGYIFLSGTQIRKPIPTISIEEAEEKLKGYGEEVKIKN